MKCILNFFPSFVDVFCLLSPQFADNSRLIKKEEEEEEEEESLLIRIRTRFLISFIITSTREVSFAQASAHERVQC